MDIFKKLLCMLFRSCSRTRNLKVFSHTDDFVFGSYLPCVFVVISPCAYPLYYIYLPLIILIKFLSFSEFLNYCKNILKNKQNIIEM